MSVATARFYQMRGSISSGEYPLFTIDQDLSGFLVGSTDVKYAKGLQTVIDVPMFAGWEYVNVIEIDGQYYWATMSEESTTVNGSVTFVLDFMGPTSFFRRYATAKGNWHKLPTRSGYMRQQVMNDVMKIKDSEVFGSLICPEECYWVQASGLDSNNEVQIYGFFVKYAGVGAIDFYPDGVAINASENKVYPTVRDLFKSISDTLPGLTAQTLIDVSISKRCPFYFESGDADYGTRNYIQLKLTSGGSAVEPTKVNTNGTYVYDLTPSNPLEILGTLFNFASESVELDLSNYEIDCGTVSVMDWNKNSVMEIIPTDSDALTITANMYMDVSGVYTIITSGDQQITLTEGKIPYFESTWDTYRAYQMDTDRMAMNNAIEYARQQAELDAITGVMNTAINAATTGVMAGAVSGSGLAGAGVGIASQIAGTAVSLYASDRQRQLTELKAKNDYELSQKKAVQRPQTAYNTAYGIVYCNLNEKNPLRVTIAVPNHLDSAYYAAWCGDMGYPAEGVKNVTIGYGYYQGKLLNNAIEQTGMYWDRCNETFMNGFKFVTP